MTQIAWTEAETVVSVDVQGGKVVLTVKNGSITLSPETARQIGADLQAKAKQIDR
jgi:ferric-dicitrate binding protein FerR (iron transport regulator)